MTTDVFGVSGFLGLGLTILKHIVESFVVKFFKWPTWKLFLKKFLSLDICLSTEHVICHLSKKCML